MAAEEIERTERQVNEAIEAGMTVYADTVPLEIGKQIRGLRAVFGERYPDVVRVVSIGKPVDELVKQPDNSEWNDYSIEFCGGTHLETTDEAGHFVITHEGALAAGVRRITALTGTAARAAQETGRALERQVRDALELEGAALEEAADAINSEYEHLTISATDRHRVAPLIDQLRERVKQARKQQQSAARSGAVEQARDIAQAAEGPVIVARVDGADKDTLLSAMDVIKAKCPESAAMLFAPDEAEGKVAIAAIVPKTLIDRGLKAGDWVREAAKICGGGGGGRPNMAQAGGKDPAKVADAIVAARTFAQEKLS
jgi:alanyl-tRNA synthetase